MGDGLPAVRDDRGSDAVPAAQEDEAGRGGGAGEGRGGGVQQQVLRGRQVPVQAGGLRRSPRLSLSPAGFILSSSVFLPPLPPTHTHSATGQRPHTEVGLPGGRSQRGKSPSPLPLHQLRPAGGGDAGGTLRPRRKSLQQNISQNLSKASAQKRHRASRQKKILFSVNDQILAVLISDGVSRQPQHRRITTKEAKPTTITANT